MKQNFACSLRFQLIKSLLHFAQRKWRRVERASLKQSHGMRMTGKQEQDIIPIITKGNLIKQ